MATRFRLTSDTTAPSVAPAFQTYTHTAVVGSLPASRELLPAGSDSSTLTTTAYTPDTADHIVAGDALHVQFVSDPMVSGISFTNAQTIKYSVQCLEANAGNNLFVQLFVSIVDSTGATVRRVLLPKSADATELATTLTSRANSVTQSGATYVTVTGDRLVVEFSVVGTPVATSQVQGHNASFRWGSSGASGDLLENDTTTATTNNGWIEFVSTITFVPPPVFPDHRIRTRQQAMTRAAIW